MTPTGRYSAIAAFQCRERRDRDIPTGVLCISYQVFQKLKSKKQKKD
jgi:hypothetical protein